MSTFVQPRTAVHDSSVSTSRDFQTDLEAFDANHLLILLAIGNIPGILASHLVHLMHQK